MGRTLEYALIFIWSVLSQLLIFDNLHIGTFVLPYVYPLFIILLPLETKQVWVLLLSALLGLLIDVMGGTPAINLAAATFIGFCRFEVIALFLGRAKELLRGVPSSSQITTPKFLAYTFVMLFLHSSFLLTLDSLSFFNFGYLVIRVLLSSALSTIIIFISQLPLNRGYRSNI